MERTLPIRRAFAATLTAAAAIAAHGGPALLRDPRWMLTAVTVAVVATGSIAVLARVARACTAAPPPPPVWVTAVVLLAAQAAAHLALVAGGVHSGSGQTGALALHATLALAVALVMHAADLWLGTRLRTLAAALVAQLASMVMRSPGRTISPRSRARGTRSAPRAPPLPA